MKRALALIALLSMLAAGFSVPALAGDSGDERLIPVKKWKCSLCGEVYMTLPSDIISPANGQAQMADGDFQQRQFKLFKDTGRSVPKCSKNSVTGGHMFAPAGMDTVTPMQLSFNSDKFIVLFSGKNNAIRLNRLKCLLCGDVRFCFTGDDLDQWDPLLLKAPSHLYVLGTNQTYPPCSKQKYWDGRNAVEIKHHLFHSEGSFTPASAWEIARNANRIVFSD